MSLNSNLRYRRNVAAFVLDSRGLILLCERSDVPGSWQLPQGGVEESESLEDAVLRELSEEIGTSEVDIIAQLEEPIRYEWPESLWDRGFRGQEQTYFVCSIRTGASINILATADFPEFRAYRWVDLEDFCSLIGGFKREAYLLALERVMNLFPGLIKTLEE